MAMLNLLCLKKCLIFLKAYVIYELEAYGT
jgi:hypothetical protein